MNIIQWLQKNISVIAIIVSLISLVLSIGGIVRSSTIIQQQKKLYRLKKFWSLRYGVFHAIILFCLTLYILLNWERCISMQFFSQFNGDNILFLVWIADILLFFYDVEIKAGKVNKRNIEEANRQIKEKDYERQLEQREKDVDRTLLQISIETNGGEKQ